MPTFAYRARDGKGQAVRGRLEAADERAAVQALRARGLIVTGLEAARGAASPAAGAPRAGRHAPGPLSAAPPPGLALPGGPGPALAPRPAAGDGVVEIDLGRLWQSLGEGLSRLGRGIPLRDLALFARQFAHLLEAGVPILNGLRVVGGEVSNRRLRAALAEIAADLEQGRTLAEAIGARQGRFPPILQHMVAAGEQGGFLAETFQRLADHFEKEEALNQKIRSATMYPKAVIAVAVLIVFFLITFVVPSFRDILANMDAQLPPQTRLLLDIGDFLRRFWYVTPLPVIGIYLAVRAVAARPRGRRFIDRVALRVPVFGEMGVKRALARFSRTLGTLLQGGVPILAALALVEKTMENAVLEDVVRDAATEVREGRSMLAALRRSPHFPRAFVEMVGVGEETGRTEEMFYRTADFYENEVARTAERLTSLIEPFIIVFLGGIVAFIMLSVFMPLFEVYRNVQ